MILQPVLGVRLEVQRIAAPAGAPTLAPLVFLHEGLGSVAMWRDWPATVCAATCRAGLVYSRQGYGQSDPTPDVRGAPSISNGRRHGRLLPDYLHREAWQVLPALLAQEGIASPVLVGHSDGGSIALLYASRFPTTACIVMAPHVIVEDISVQAIAQAKQSFETGDLRERLARFHADVDGAFWQWNDVWLSPGFRTFDIRDDCRAITAPVLAIQGESDPYGTMAQIDDIQPNAAIGVPVVRRKLSECGHSPHREQSERTLTSIEEFLAKLP
jgi:pimeloyl-ACP methyl ester carboxylesterase